MMVMMNVYLKVALEQFTWAIRNCSGTNRSLGVGDFSPQIGERLGKVFIKVLSEIRFVFFSNISASDCSINVGVPKVSEDTIELENIRIIWRRLHRLIPSTDRIIHLPFIIDSSLLHN